MIAESSVPLTPGARLAVTVAGLEPKIHLRILEPDTSSNARLLKELGIELPSREAEALLDRLRDRGQPIDRTSFMKMLQAVRQGLTPDQAARLVERRLPFNQSIFDRLKAADGDLGKTVARLLDSLKAAGREAEATTISRALTFDGDLGRLLDEHPLKHERRLLASEARPDDAAAVLRRLAAETAAGTSMEREIAGEAARLLELLEGRYLAGDPEPQIPFLIEDDGAREGSIAAERSPGRATVRFRLETSVLGEVRGVIDFVGKVMGVTIGAATPAARAVLARKAPQLKESLDALGFRIESLGVEVTRPGGAAEAAITALPPVGLDIKA
jgi:hypothetical protein